MKVKSSASTRATDVFLCYDNDGNQTERYAEIWCIPLEMAELV